MRSSERYTPKPQADVETIPFDSAEEAWFWFMQAQQARNDGARFVVGQGLVPRPCEPMDILKILDRLHRNRRLLLDHFRVLRHYGLRMMPPDDRRPREFVAAKLWREALERIGVAMESKGLLRRTPGNHWWLEAAE